MSFFPSIFVPFYRFSLCCMESASYVFPFRMVLPCDHGLNFDMNSCENSFERLIKKTVGPPLNHRQSHTYMQKATTATAAVVLLDNALLQYY